MRRFYKNKWRGGTRFAGFIPAHYREIWNGSTPVDFVSVAADVDGSGDITITDAVAVIDMLLEGNAPAKGRKSVVENAEARIRFVVDAEATAIKGVASEGETGSGVYTLQGVALGGIKDVENLPRGVYILDGKKVSVK